MRLALSLRLWLYAAAILLWATGSVWLLVRYFLPASSKTEGIAAFSMEIHGAATMLILVVAGMTVALHVPASWRERKNRRSGLAVSIVLIVLALTGYALYYAGGESARAFASLGHWLPGVVLPIVGVWHGVGARRTRGQ